MDGVPEVIKSDKRVLKKTMHNLLSNALKFTEDHGLVTICAKMVDCYTRPGRRRGDPESFQVILDPMSNEKESGATHHKCFEIAVSDTGIGIRSEDHDRIFNRLEQVDCTAQKKYQGTGLGLALTKSLVELAGGKIWVESEGKDKGSTFRFIIPT
jgi:Amt family ammonium transporter